MNTHAADLAVVNCGELVTMAGPPQPRTGAELGELGIVRDCTLLVRDGRVLSAMPHPQARERMTPETRIIDAHHGLVTPGFVDAHTHLVFAGNRADEFARRIAGETYQQIAASGGGIQNTVEKTRAASEEELLASARLRLAWMRTTGTTAIEAKSGYGLSLKDELKVLRVMKRLQQETAIPIVPTVLAAHTVPPEYRDKRTAYVQLVCEEILPAVASENLAAYCDVFCDEHAFTLDEAEQILATAKSMGFGLRIHAEQFAADGSAAMAAQLGAAAADHLEQSTPQTFAQLRTHRTQPVLLPASVYCIGSTKYPDARGMITAGLALVLATDFNPGSSPATSMPFVLSLASLQMRMSPAEALSAATINAAYSIGLGASCGSLEAGKRGDFCVWPYRDHREIAYWLGGAQPRVFTLGIGTVSEQTL